MRGLESIGYAGDLLKSHYPFCDWFHLNQPSVEISIAAFATTPVSYDSACFGVATTPQIEQYRALGAPYIFQIHDNQLNHWEIGVSDSRIVESIRASDVVGYFKSKANDWNPDSFLRAKTLGKFSFESQLGLFDGLIPELENRIQQVLAPLMTLAFSKVEQHYTGRSLRFDQLVQLVFWTLTGKVFNDRNVRGFRSLSRSSDPQAVISSVAKHYGVAPPRLLDAVSRQIVMDTIWQKMDFRNLSVEVLGELWSGTLVTEEVQKSLGIHRTPSSLVKYLIGRLPDFEIDKKETILEPCCGSSAFLLGAMSMLKSKHHDMSPAVRHRFFTKHLVGLEKDSFGLEVSKLSLTLADFPNANGWKLHQRDVFEDDLSSEFGNARVVLCNPPFETFTESERLKYDLRSHKKPAELLHRMLDSLSDSAILGILLPRSILDNAAYKDIRQRLATRFGFVEITELPDAAFEVDPETVILIAWDQSKCGDDKKTTLVRHRKVYDNEHSKNAFFQSFDVSSDETEAKTISQSSKSLAVPPLNRTWKFFNSFPLLKDVSDIKRGIQWSKPLTEGGKETGNRSKLVRPTPAKGFVRGVAPLSKFNAYEAPKLEFLDFRKENRYLSAFDLPWGEPKVIVNKSARRRGAWRMAAFADDSGALACYQTFYGIWPTSDIDVYCLAAVLNGPIANAFVTTRAGKIDITAGLLKSIPIPLFNRSQAKKIQSLTKQFVQEVQDNGENAARLLLEIDSVVLDAYQLPPLLEKEILDFQSMSTDRPASCSFDGYYDPDLKSCFSLSQYLSEEFNASFSEKLLERLQDD